MLNVVQLECMIHIWAYVGLAAVMPPMKHHTLVCTSETFVHLCLLHNLGSGEGHCMRAL